MKTTRFDIHDSQKNPPTLAPINGEGIRSNSVLSKTCLSQLLFKGVESQPLHGWKTKREADEPFKTHDKRSSARRCD